jgi:putative peptidoglycan lipid II flippase
MLLQVALATVLMTAVLWWLSGDTGRWLDWGAWQRARWMTLLVLVGAGTYFGVLLITGLRVRDLFVRAAAGRGGSDGPGPRPS